MWVNQEKKLRMLDGNRGYIENRNLKQATGTISYHRYITYVDTFQIIIIEQVRKCDTNYRTER